MGAERPYRAGHHRTPRGRTQPLIPATVDAPDGTREDDMAPTKGPSRRHPHAICPTCHTEFRVYGQTQAAVPCPECNTLTPIANAKIGGIINSPRATPG